MLPFDDALQRIVTSASLLGSERVPVAHSAGRVLATDLRAHSPIPAFDYSAMDGYAVDSAAFHGAGGWDLPVIGESCAGRPAPALTPGSACRIFTGAAIPAGANAVVMQEDVTRSADRAQFSAAPQLGANIRKCGEDLPAGAIALLRGTRCSAFHVGLAAALDVSEVVVARRPRVAILCTGEELRAPGSFAAPGTIPDSNGPSLAALVTSAGGVAELMPRVGDTLPETEQALRAALSGVDLLLTVGGVSVGDHDWVRVALERIGASLEFWKVAIKPGKPLAFGRLGSTHILGLPGNPVSAQITFALFGIPLLRALQGDSRPVPTRGRARLQHALTQKPGRTGFYRATLEGDSATLSSNQASGSPASLALANALVIIPAESVGAAAGESVEVLRLAEL